MTAAIRASVVAFDAYGTVFDLASAVRRHADVVGPGAATLAQTWRQKQLEYTWVRTLAGRVVPFWDVTVAALDYALATVPHVNPMARDALLDAYRSLDAYADAVDAIDGVVARGMRVAILSNGDPSMVAEAVRGAGLEGRFHAVVSVAGTGAFKVDPICPNYFRKRRAGCREVRQRGILRHGFTTPATIRIFAPTSGA